MATIYVSTSGSDTASGSSAAPVKTLSKGAALAKAGDTVIVKAGTYPGLVVISCNGTSAAPITIKSETVGKAILDGTGTAADKNLVQINGDYVIFQGFEVRDGTRGGISLYNTHHTRVLECNVHDNVKNGIYVGGSASATYDNLVAGCEVWHNVLENSARTASGGWARGIGVSESDRIVVRDCKVYNNFGEGIGLLSCIGGKILNNIVHDNYSVLIYLDNAQEATVQYNNVHHTGNVGYYRSGRPAHGISICNENTGRMLPSTGITITQNVIGGSGDVRYSTYGANTGMSDSTITPNTITTAENAAKLATGTPPTEPPTEPVPPIEPPIQPPTTELVVAVQITKPKGVRVDVKVIEISQQSYEPPEEPEPYDEEPEGEPEEEIQNEK